MREPFLSQAEEELASCFTDSEIRDIAKAQNLYLALAGRLWQGKGGRVALDPKSASAFVAALRNRASCPWEEPEEYLDIDLKAPLDPWIKNKLENHGFSLQEKLF